jgi:hypothetical protein
MPNEARSQETGKPEFDLVDFIRKVAAGDPNNIIERPARKSDQYEFPQQWAAYKNNQQYRPESGTPIEDWPRIDMATAAKLKALEFHTVEQVAEASDAQIQRIGMGAYELRNKAIAFIKQAKDSAYAQKQADELAIREQRILDLEATIQRQAARLELLEEQQEKRGPGRPRKEQ